MAVSREERRAYEASGDWTAFKRWRKVAYGKQMSPEDADNYARRKIGAHVTVVVAGKKGTTTVTSSQEPTGLAEVTLNEESQWRELLSAVEGKKATPKDEMDWVMNNLHKSVENLDPDSVPSAAAVNTLRWAKLSPVNEAELHKKRIAEGSKSKTDEVPDPTEPTEDEKTQSVIKTIEKLQKAGKK